MTTESIQWGSWSSYPSIYALGHRYVADLLLDDVEVTEKVDGSQFSFGYFPGHPDYPDGWRFRSKGAQLNDIAPQKMFEAAMNHVRTLPVTPGWTYRGEVLAKPKHNALAYNRTPKGNVIIFNINPGHECYLGYEDMARECDRIGLECVPLILRGKIESPEIIRGWLERTSCLGGQKIEGVVIKNYARFGIDKKVLMGKFVSEAFKEVHNKEWRTANPTNRDIIGQLVVKYKSPARWQKAVQHLREAGKLEDSPRDIGLLIAEVPNDVLKEEESEMKDYLFAHAWPHIRRGLTGGLPEWYKQQLMEKQFQLGGSAAIMAAAAAKEREEK